MTFEDVVRDLEADDRELGRTRVIQCGMVFQHVGIAKPCNPALAEKAYLYDVEVMPTAFEGLHQAFVRLTDDVAGKPHTIRDLHCLRRNFSRICHPDRFAIDEERNVATRFMQAANELIDRSIHNAQRCKT